MSDKEARKEDQPKATEKAEERKLSVEDEEAGKAKDVKGGGIRTFLDGTGRPGGGGG